MAETSITVNASKVFEYDFFSGQGAKYREFTGDSILCQNKKALILALPDLKSTLGNKKIYRIEINESLSSTKTIWYIHAHPLKEPLPTLSPGNTYTDCSIWTIFKHCWIWFCNRAVPYTQKTDLVISEVTGDGASPVNLSGYSVEVLKNKAVVLSVSGDYAYAYKTKVNGTAPSITIYYDNTDAPLCSVTKLIGPKSGYYDPREAINLQWEIRRTDSDANYYCLDESFDVTDLKFRWKTSSDPVYNTIDLPTDAESYTIPADTFPTGESITWYIYGHDEYSRLINTSYFTFSTAASPIEVSLISPTSSVEDMWSPITFSWNLSSADNFPASRVILEYKLPEDETWTEIADVDEPITEYTVDAGFYQVAGEKQWRVTAYNIDGVIGEPAEASFLAIGAPATPTVFSNDKPFLTITWQADDQQGYEIEINGKTYGPYFGTEKVFNFSDYFEDGEYIARVRVMGRYGNMWSKWGEAYCTIQNGLYTEFPVVCRTNVDAELEWAIEEDASYFLIYRDGKQIARTSNNYFTDRLSLGTHEYAVICRLQNDDYSKSRTIVKTESVDCLHVALLNGEEWVRIEHSKKSQSEPKYNDKMSVGYTHLSGHRYPVADYFEFYDTDAEYTAVFLYTEEKERRRFVSMFGKPVILKTPDDEVVIGILEGWTRESREQKVNTYTFTIHRVDWGDFIDVP